MSQVKLGTDLLLGIPEFKKLDKSYRERGYLTLSKVVVNNYGIVINDKLSSSLRLFPGSSGKVSVKSGLAVNKNHEYISVDEDIVNAITVPDDSNEYFITISYKQTLEEKGTVSITPEGSIAGIGTEFLSILRGVSSRLPTKIRFTNSSNNISEYEIASIISNELAYLNVVPGILVAETGIKYSVVGTFTPSIVIDESNKYPFLNDSYLIKVSLTDLSDNQLEFLLGSVVNSGGVVTIKDSRDSNRFSLINNRVSKVNPIIGTEWVKYSSLNSSGLNNTIQIGWGLVSSSGGWSIDSSGEITVGSVKGGIWQSIAELIDENLLVGWRVVFPDGKVSKILSVNISGGVAKLLTTITSSNLTGPLYIVPDCETIQISIESVTDSNITKTFSFDSNMRSCTVEVESNSTIKISYRHLKSNVGNSAVNLLNTGPYIPEDNFTSEGVQSSNTLDTSTGGILNIKRRASTIITVLDSILPIGGIIDYTGSESDVPTNWVICDGREITNVDSPLYGQLTPNFQGRVAVGLNPVDVDFDTISATGGVKTVTLSGSQNGPHTHDAAVTDSQHRHNMLVKKGVMGTPDYSNPGGSGEGSRRTMIMDTDLAAKTELTSSNITVAISSSPAAEAHPNLQPYLVVYKIMRIL